VQTIQAGLPLVPDPFAKVATACGVSQATVIAMIEEMLQHGVIKRFGVVVRHHELGWRANAMCVWDVPDSIADELGSYLAGEAAVTLCYRRRRGARERAAGWPYNLFCMIHGQQRETVQQQHAELCQRLKLNQFPSAVLFSTQRYKQCGARYGHPLGHD
jgi:DNA-binding Lrp family transcriptional regulator